MYRLAFIAFALGCSHELPLSATADPAKVVDAQPEPAPPATTSTPPVTSEAPLEEGCGYKGNLICCLGPPGSKPMCHPR